MFNVVRIFTETLPPPKSWGWLVRDHFQEKVIFKVKPNGIRWSWRGKVRGGVVPIKEKAF